MKGKKTYKKELYIFAENAQAPKWEGDNDSVLIRKGRLRPCCREKMAEKKRKKGGARLLSPAGGTKKKKRGTGCSPSSARGPSLPARSKGGGGDWCGSGRCCLSRVWGGVGLPCLKVVGKEGAKMADPFGQNEVRKKMLGTWERPSRDLGRDGLSQPNVTGGKKKVSNSMNWGEKGGGGGGLGGNESCPQNRTITE